MAVAGAEIQGVVTGAMPPTALKENGVVEGRGRLEQRLDGFDGPSRLAVFQPFNANVGALEPVRDFVVAALHFLGGDIRHG